MYPDRQLIRYYHANYGKDFQLHKFQYNHLVIFLDLMTSRWSRWRSEVLPLFKKLNCIPLIFSRNCRPRLSPGVQRIQSSPVDIFQEYCYTAIALLIVGQNLYFYNIWFIGLTFDLNVMAFSRISPKFLKMTEALWC